MSYSRIVFLTAMLIQFGCDDGQSTKDGRVLMDFGSQPRLEIDASLSADQGNLIATDGAVSMVDAALLIDSAMNCLPGEILGCHCRAHTTQGSGRCVACNVHWPLR